MFGIMDVHHAHYFTGLYYASYPDFNTDGGVPFKYREQIKSNRMNDVVQNLANEAMQKTIVTTYALRFKIEAYVLLCDELYRIIDISSAPLLPQSGAVIKSPRKAKTLVLNRVSNPLEITI